MTLLAKSLSFRCYSVSSNIIVSHVFVAVYSEMLYSVSEEAACVPCSTLSIFVTVSVPDLIFQEMGALCFTVQMKKKTLCITGPQCLLDTCIVTKRKTWMFFLWKVYVLEMYIFHRTVTIGNGWADCAAKLQLQLKRNAGRLDPNLVLSFVQK